MLFPSAEPDYDNSTPAPSIPAGGAGTCDGTWNYKPDLQDCTYYFQCTEGQAVKKKCPSGLHWNQYSHTCDWAEYARCTAGSQQTEAPPPQPSTYPTTTTPTTTTIAAPRPTQPPQTPRPVPVVTTTNRPSFETGCASGDYSPGPTCDRYYVCVSGTRTLQSCGPGLHWNADKKLCDWPANGEPYLRVI